MCVDISNRVKSGRIIVGNKTNAMFLDSMRLSLENSVTLYKKCFKRTRICLSHFGIQLKTFPIPKGVLYTYIKYIDDTACR